MVGGLDLFISLFNNLALYVVLVAVYGFLNTRLTDVGSRRRQVTLGVVFGLFVIGFMQVKIPVYKGVLVDQRTSVVILSGAFGGPLSAATLTPISST